MGVIIGQFNWTIWDSTAKGSSWYPNRQQQIAFKTGSLSRSLFRLDSVLLTGHLFSLSAIQIGNVAIAFYFLRQMQGFGSFW